MKAGWQTKALGNAFTTVTGNTPPKTNTELYGDFVPLVKPPELCDSPFDSATDGLSETGAAVARMLPPQSILVSCIGILGKIGLNTVPVAFNQQINAILPDPGQAVPEFMYYQALSRRFKEQLETLASGTTVPIVNKSKFNSIEIVLAPLAEQRRIVGILDEAFEGIATAKSNAEKNLKNARAVFESHLHAVFTQRGKGWVEQKLVDVAESISTGPFGTMLHKSDYISNGIPLVNPMNIVESRIVPSSRMMVSTETRERLCSYVLQTGDVVIGRRGDLGRCALVTDTEAGWICGTGSFFLRLSKAMDGKYFVALFSSKKFRKRLENSAVGSTMSNLNHSILKELLIPVPPIADQKSIMARADEMLCEVARLESIYQQKLSTLDELKKSLLHQAFTGAL